MFAFDSDKILIKAERWTSVYNSIIYSHLKNNVDDCRIIFLHFLSHKIIQKITTREISLISTSSKDHFPKSLISVADSAIVTFWYAAHTDKSQAENLKLMDRNLHTPNPDCRACLFGRTVFKFCHFFILPQILKIT